MKKIAMLILAALVWVSIAACEDDDPNKPANKSDLYGTWVYEKFDQADTLIYNLNLDERNGKISGYGQYRNIYIKTTNGSTEKVEVVRKGNVEGALDGRTVYVDFLEENRYPFRGELTQDAQFINGRLATGLDKNGDTIFIDMILDKQIIYD